MVERMKTMKRLHSLVSVALLMTVLLVPAAWAAGDVQLQQQGDDGDGATELATDSLVYVSATVEKMISESSDDAEEETSGPNLGRVRTGGSDLELGTDTGISQIVGMRFDALGIPQGATVSDAYIEFVSKEDDSDATSLTITAENDVNPATYLSDDFDISNRATVSPALNVNWSGVAPWTVGGVYRTPSLRFLIQDLVGRPSWVPGNAIAFQITGFGRRTAWAVDGDAAKAPKLVVNYAGTVNCYSLTATASPAGKGVVVKDPEPNCEGNRYYAGTVVELTALPEPSASAANYAFSNWSGSATGTTNPINVTMDANKVVTANYVVATCYPLNTAVVPVVAPPDGPIGEIRPDPDLNCGGGRYVAGTVLTVSAVAKGGWSFAGWSGSLSGTLNPETLTMDGTKTVTAAFTEACRTIDIKYKPDGGGTVEFNPPPNCTLSKWNPNTVVELRAMPAAGYFFVKWNIENEEVWDNPTTVIMDSNKVIDVTFREGSYKSYLPAVSRRFRK
jgi:hypothetical protein